MEIQATKCEIKFAKHITDKRQTFKIHMTIMYKSRKADHLIKKWARDLKT